MSIRLDMPREFDLVGSPVLIGGIGTGFEATINYRIHEATTRSPASSPSAAAPASTRSSRSASAVAQAPRSRSTGCSSRSSRSARRTARSCTRSRARCCLATRMVKGYIGFREHTVKAGDTLTKIARKHYGTDDFQPIFRANVHLLDDPDVIQLGQVLRVPIGS